VETVAVIDCGSGNLRSVEKALREAARRSGADVDVRVTDRAEAVATADRVVLPGVGAFAACKAGLEARPGMLEAMGEAARKRAVPFLGVCVGMQLLATRGMEFGETAGLGWIPGEVRKLTPADPGLSVPHMGWNAVEAVRPHPLLEDGRAMYFANSFAFHPTDAQSSLAVADHGGRFTAAVARENIAGVQFHPEKSQDAGLDLLARFLAWRP
jgi:glutamine amidotransferase